MYDTEKWIQEELEELNADLIHARSIKDWNAVQKIQERIAGLK